MSWTIPKIWDGGDVWILGGGPSVAKQFDIPNNVVLNVKNGTSPLSVYSKYMSPIHNKHVIGINVAYQIGDWMDMCFFGDVNFLLTQREVFSHWPGIKVTCHRDGAYQPWIKFIDKDREHPRGISTRPDRVSWNQNSGAAAISIAAWAGAKRIFLLGFDMHLGDDKKMHFHDAYNRGPIDIKDEARYRSWMGVFDRHLRGFPYIKEDAQKMRIEIINICPDSAITEFPRVSLRDVL
jgi:hypothetical protein